jgi:hypothetical protein
MGFAQPTRKVSCAKPINFDRIVFDSNGKEKMLHKRELESEVKKLKLLLACQQCKDCRPFQC